MLMNIAQLTVDCDKTTVEEHQVFRIFLPLNFDIGCLVFQGLEYLNLDEYCAIDS